mmetsp:Transcript_17972/g.72046  ORF Transcript_17972/g.72046 Transcript_17972/m.72046 type:complete len:611 (+) Transcript_17972:193-2025(+)
MVTSMVVVGRQQRDPGAAVASIRCAGGGGPGRVAVEVVGDGRGAAQETREGRRRKRRRRRRGRPERVHISVAVGITLLLRTMMTGAALPHHHHHPGRLGPQSSLAVFASPLGAEERGQAEVRPVRLGQSDEGERPRAEPQDHEDRAIQSVGTRVVIEQHQIEEHRLVARLVVHGRRHAPRRRLLRGDVDREQCFDEPPRIRGPRHHLGGHPAESRAELPQRRRDSRRHGRRDEERDERQVRGVLLEGDRDEMREARAREGGREAGPVNRQERRRRRGRRVPRADVRGDEHGEFRDVHRDETRDKKRRRRGVRAAAIGELAVRRGSVLAEEPRRRECHREAEREHDDKGHFLRFAERVSRVQRRRERARGEDDADVVEDVARVPDDAPDGADGKERALAPPRTRRRSLRHETCRRREEEEPSFWRVGGRVDITAPAALGALGGETPRTRLGSRRLCPQRAQRSRRRRPTVIVRRRRRHRDAVEDELGRRLRRRRRTTVVGVPVPVQKAVRPWFGPFPVERGGRGVGRADVAHGAAEPQDDAVVDVAPDARRRLVDDGDDRDAAAPRGAPQCRDDGDRSRRVDARGRLVEARARPRAHELRSARDALALASR